MCLSFFFVNEITLFILCIRKFGKAQKRGKTNLIGRLQLTTEKSREEDNEGIMQLRILRVQVMREKAYCFVFIGKFQHLLEKQY